MSKVAVIAKITAASGKRADVIEQLKPMFPQAAAEAGTELYILHEDASDPDVLWMYELYTDHDALQVHSSSEAMGALIVALGGELMGAPPELIVLNPLQGKGAGI